ncbi:hypothetical protein VTN49DRAFT_7724 [Thermomyces lanuginosus]|uniref:uncharacterized protein n=1 Tax=Thermomyces lanuginosus TaxID=5541 RepID=UPI0037448DFD
MRSSTLIASSLRRVTAPSYIYKRTPVSLFRPTPRFFTASRSTSFRQSPVTMVVSQVKGKSDFDAAIQGGQLVVVDAYATWCGPCKAIAPKVEEYSRTYSDVKFIKFDVDESPDIAQELGIRAMPTFLLFKNGEKVEEVVGANPAAIEAAIQKHK